MMSSSLNFQISPNLLNECKPLNQAVSVNGTVNNPIRKRKVKFTIQLTIQELLSVPYLNGVLFCKVRLCDGGHYVSYSSKKEVSNSSVLWDSPIQFDVKTTQFYQYTPVVLSQENDNTMLNNQNLNSNCMNLTITGYEPCLCRISVRKELRGGKSYQKLGYVDCNLTDFIYKYQTEQNQLIQTKTNGQFQTNSNSVNSDEFSVNRILKEYETGSHISSKKNQQRLDNSYLKIKIKVIESNQNGKNLNIESGKLSQPSSLPTSPKPTKSDSPTFNLASEKVVPKVVEIEVKRPVLQQSQQVNQNPSPELQSKVQLASQATGNFTPSHSRNSSSSTTNSTVNSNNCITLQPNPFVNGHYRSCSNGSIKSNVSFDFLIKNRNKKLLEEVQSTSSSSSHVNGNQNSGTNLNTAQSNQNPQATTEASNTNTNNAIMNKLTSHSFSGAFNAVNNSSGKNEPNLHIIETRVDAAEIINQIENELTSLLYNVKSSE